MPYRIRYGYYKGDPGLYSGFLTQNVVKSKKELLQGIRVVESFFHFTLLRSRVISKSQQSAMVWI